MSRLLFPRGAPWQDRVIVDEAGCFLWQGSIDHRGYARWTSKGRSPLAHRAIYEMERGPIPAGLQLDHLCRVRSCVNPDHLEPVTQVENIRRGLRGVLTTHCPQGHPYDDANTSHWNGQRHCRACDRERARERYYRKLNRTPEADLTRRSLAVSAGTDSSQGSVPASTSLPDSSVADRSAPAAPLGTPQVQG